MAAIRNVIIGTAGHIDHGKSSLVRALTGVDPDRLAEERSRGMTIDLGFAPYRHGSGATVGIIDVPGHERFIKNMVAGSTSVDIALLVVAADDGVMPQTREHLEILRLLGVERGLIAVTKIDLVDEEMSDLVLDDVAELVAGTFLEDAVRVRLSATTGVGVDDLRSELDRLVDAVPTHDDAGPFRLPVQRVFSVKGHGLVATGVPVSGHVQGGDVLELVGTEHTLRVRGVQAYGEERDVGRAGHSTALNLAGGSRDELRRGDVLATPGVFGAARFLALDYTHVDESRPLRHRHPVRLHAGTAEVLGRTAVLETDDVEAGGSALLQLRLEEPVVCAPGDRVLLRDAASMVVLGGGVVLGLGAGRLKRHKERVLSELRARRSAVEEPVRLALVTIDASGPRGCRLPDLVRATGGLSEELQQGLAAALEEGEVVRVGQELYLSAHAVEALSDELDATLRKEHKQQPLMEWLELKTLRARLPYDDAVIQAVLEAGDRFELETGGRVRRRGHRVSLSSAQRDARERVLAALLEAGTNPPVVDESLTSLSAADTKALVKMMRAAGELVAVEEHFFHRDVMEHMRRLLLEHGRSRQGDIVIPELRDELGTTRKFLIPLLEHFDALGLTVRHGDRRVIRDQDAGATGA